MNTPKAIRFAVIAAITIATVSCYTTWSFSFFEFSKWDAGGRFAFGFIVVVAAAFGIMDL